MPKCRVCKCTLSKQNWYKSNRLKRNYICIKCAKILAHTYYIKHSTKKCKHQREYYQENKEKYSQKNKKEFQERLRVMKGLKINGCAICGYNQCGRSLDFHHTNPEDKKFNINTDGLKYTNDKITNELNKCILLCKNCHYEIEERKNKEE